MATNLQECIKDILIRDQNTLLDDWLHEQLASLGARPDLIRENELRQQSAEFLSLVTKASAHGSYDNLGADEWKSVFEFLSLISSNRARLGFSSSETATFIFSLKQPVFVRLQQDFTSAPELLSAVTWSISTLLDKLGLYTTEVYIKSREEIIKQQQIELLELSTPVVKLWEGIVAVPLIGTLDSARTMIVMENLLQSLVDTGSSIAIVDITGVPTVDTLVAQHLLKTAYAARLMGAQCLISGIRPQIAQTMVHLGVQFGNIVTKATLADALAYAFQQIGQKVSKQALVN